MRDRFKNDHQSIIQIPCSLNVFNRKRRMSVNPTEHPVLEVIRDRWSPYRFDSQVVEDDKLVECLGLRLASEHDAPRRQSEKKGG